MCVCVCLIRPAQYSFTAGYLHQAVTPPSTPTKCVCVCVSGTFSTSFQTPIPRDPFPALFQLIPLISNQAGSLLHHSLFHLSFCLSLQVGACIVNQENKIVGIGYNGMPNGCDDDLLPWSRSATDRLDTKYPYGKAT